MKWNQEFNQAYNAFTNISDYHRYGVNYIGKAFRFEKIPTIMNKRKQMSCKNYPERFYYSDVLL